MNKKLAALAISIALCSTSALDPVVLAAATKSSSSNIPMIKSSISQNNTHVELTLGKAQIIRLNTPASRVSISDPEVVSLVLISPTEVELIGKAVGVANLLVWSEKSGENYLAVDLSVHRDVSTLAHKIQMVDPGINILPVAAEDSVILTGIAESMEKAQLAYDLAKAFFTDDKAGAAGAAETSSNSPGSNTMAPSSTKIINLIRIMGQPTTKAEMVQERLKDIDSSIVLNVVPGFGGKEKAILHGRVKNASMVSKAVNLTSVFYGTPGIKVLTGPGGNVVKEGTEASDASFKAGDSGGGLIGNLAGNVLHGSIISDTSGNVISMMEVEERPQVKCSIKFMEVRKNTGLNFASMAQLDSKHLKFSTYAGASGQLTPAELVGQITGTNAAQLGVLFGQSFGTLMNGLVTTGKVRILAEPNITSISGEPASFLAGGEFPIPVIGANGSVSVIFKQFGIRLNILATVTDRGTIHMQISPEVSSLDPTAGITLNGMVVPGLRSRKSQTVLEMKNGDNFVLGGLYNEDMTDTYNKTPLLGQIPILGNLFRSKAYQRNETEMIIVIHPEIQSQMNLSNLPSYKTSTSSSEIQSEIKETIKIEPEALFKELKAAQSKDKTGTKAETASQSQETPSAASILKDDKPKSRKEMLKEIKNAQKEANKASKMVLTGKAPVVQTTTVAGAAAPVSTSDKPSDTDPVAVVTPSGISEDYLKTQRETLAQIMKNLNTTLDEQPQSVELPLPQQEKKQVSEPSVKNAPTAEVKKSAFPAKAATPEVKSPVAAPAAKTSVHNSTHARTTARGYSQSQLKTKRIVEQNLKQIQKQLTQLLSFDN